VDRPRLLASRSEVGYVDSTRRALVDEPEAVSAEEQAHLTRQAHVAGSRRRRREWQAIRGCLEEQADALKTRFGPEVSNELRELRRTIDRLERKLAA